MAFPPPHFPPPAMVPPPPPANPPPPPDEKMVKKEKKKKKEKPRDKVPIPGTSWLRVTTTEENVFYTNTETKESVWIVPEEIREAVEVMEKEERERKKEERRRKEEEQKRELEEAMRKEREEAMRKEQEERERRQEEEKRELERIREEMAEDRAKQEQQELQQKEREEETNRKRKRTETGTVVDAVEEQQEEVEGKGKRTKVDAVDAANEGEDEDGDDDEAWQRHIAAEMAAEADGGASAPPEPEMEQRRPLPPGPPPVPPPGMFQSSAPPPAAGSGSGTPAVGADVELSFEEAKAIFKKLLSESVIAPMAPWDRELPKFINDPRYTLVKTLKDRQDIFNEFCKEKIREQRAQKKEKPDPATAYRLLLVSSVTSTRTRFEDFKKAHKKDPSFYNFGRDDRDREKSFKAWLKELGEKKKAEQRRAEEEFLVMLREKAKIEPGSVWKDVKRPLTSDPRYDAVGSSTLREELFNRYKSGLQGSSTYRDSERPGSSAPVGMARNDSRDSRAEDDQRHRKMDRKEREAQSLREREEKVRRERAKVEREKQMAFRAASKEDSEREFNQLLIDAVRDPHASYTSAVPSLSRDPRFNLPGLTDSLRRELFTRHLSHLYAGRLSALHKLFERVAPRLDASFEDTRVREALERAPEVGRVLGKSEGTGENEEKEEGETDDGARREELRRLFEEWRKKRESDAREAFQELLRENSFVEFWGRLRQAKKGADGQGEGKDVPPPDSDEEEEDAADMYGMASQIDLGKMHDVLKNDSRYQAFDHVPDEREEWMREYLQGMSAPKQTVYQRR